MAKAMDVIWKGAVIGSMPDPRIDNFFIYGSWTRTASPETWQALVEALDTDGEVPVELRGSGKPLMGKILVEPDDDEIEVRFDPSR
jgi:hypothetical protein